MEETIMNSKDFKAMLSSGTLTRRQMNKLLASAGILAASMPAISLTALAADPMLQVFTWAGYDRPELHKAFSAKYGSSPEFSLLVSNNEARAKVRSGFTPDLAVPSFSLSPFWKDDGLVEKIDISRLSHWPELFDRFKSLEPEGDRYFVPWTWGATAVVYRTDLVPEYADNPTWGILWDQKLKGKIAIRDAFMGAILPAALYAGVKDAFDMTDEELEAVGVLLRKQRELVRFYWKAEADAQQALASGEIVAISGWNSTYATLRKQGVPVGFMIPKEGMPGWIDGYMKIKGGQASEQQKYDFMDAALTAESGVGIIEELGYGAANKKSFDIADPEKVAMIGVDDVDSIVEKGMWSRAVPPETKDKMVDLHNRVKAGF
jgi:spermidine/putrescine transport system substrate-binding protein